MAGIGEEKGEFAPLPGAAAAFTGEKGANANDDDDDDDDEGPPATAFNICVKDGDAAGQPVRHVHVHVVPRRPGDLANNDEIYELIDAWTPGRHLLYGGQDSLLEADGMAFSDDDDDDDDDRRNRQLDTDHQRPLDIPDDADREPRTAEDMAAEADQYALFAATTVASRVSVCAPFFEAIGGNNNNHNNNNSRRIGGASSSAASSSSSSSSSSSAPVYSAQAAAAGQSRPGPEEAVYFSPKIRLDPRQVFWVSASGLTMALVNLKPLVRGHVLVVPRRYAAPPAAAAAPLPPGAAAWEGAAAEAEAAEAAADLGGDPARSRGLTRAEREDLWDSVRRVMDVVCGYYGCTGATIGLQDGRDAGQSVPHTHVHILPRGGPGEGEAAPGDCFPPPAPGAAAGR